MPIPAFIEKLDAVAEPLRANYKEVEGGFALDTDVDAHPGVAGLKSAHERQKEITRAAKAEAAALKAELAKLQKPTDDDDDKGGDKGGDKDKDKVEKLVQKRLAEVNTKLATLAAKAEATEKENRYLKLHSVTSKAALEAGVLPEALDDALAASDKSFSFNDKGKLIVVDEEGDDTGQTPEQFFAGAFRKAKPWYYAAKGGSGTGSDAGKGSKGGGNGKLSGDELMKMDPVERMKAARGGK